jgi:dTDP-4-amino-4,6-dideoxygalactose transaminase
MINFLDIQKITAKHADEIHEAVNRVVDSGWYLQGEENKKFEADYANDIGTKYCVGCANGLDALIWIFRAYKKLGIMRDGDEIYGLHKKYVFQYTGRNSRLDEIQAAILDVKLKHLDEDITIRKQVAKYYMDNITNPQIILPNIFDWDQHVFHIFPIRCTERDRLQQYLTNNGIQTNIHYPTPLHKQECYKEWNNISLPVTEQIHKEELSLPMSSVMSELDIKDIVDVINAWI